MLDLIGKIWWVLTQLIQSPLIWLPLLLGVTLSTVWLVDRVLGFVINLNRFRER
jgi:hypothetical protein